MIQTLTFTAETPGPKLLFLGAVHGNETCGPEAIRRVINEIEARSLTLDRGQATFVPVANPRAYAEGKRFIERNLNRYFVPTREPDCYEAQLINILCPLLESCDVLLDLHSISAEGESFIFVDSGLPEEFTFAKALGAQTLLLGWTEAFAATGRAAQNTAHSEESTGTTEYTRRHGGLALTLECGQHKDPRAPEIAYQAIHNTLRHFGLVESAAAPQAPSRIIRMTHVHYRDEGAVWPETWRNFHPVAQGQIMARNTAHGDLKAPSDGFIILPKAFAGTGEEWFYFGVKEPTLTTP